MCILALEFNCGNKQMLYKETGGFGPTLIVSDSLRGKDWQWQNLEKEKPTAVNVSTLI